MNVNLIFVHKNLEGIIDYGEVLIPTSQKCFHPRIFKGKILNFCFAFLQTLNDEPFQLR